MYDWPFTEVFGFPVTSDSSNANVHRTSYECPFLNSPCRKIRRGSTQPPLGVCTVSRRGTAIIVCPWRFHGSSDKILNDIAQSIWNTTEHVHFLPSIRLFDKGTLDWLAVKVTDNTIDNFHGIELQAIDITGTVRQHFEAFLRGEVLQQRAKFGLNYRNVEKRLTPQLVGKGRCLNNWGKRLYVVVQRILWEYLQERMLLRRVDSGEGDIVFHIYDFGEAIREPTPLRLVERVEIPHSELVQYLVGGQLPSREEFENQILARIRSKD